MKTLIIVLMIYIMSMDLAHPVEVTTSGYGSTYKEAVNNAKMNATEKATNTFITSKQESVQGKFKERIAQYNGGFITSVNVTDTEMFQGQYKVTIDANVDIEKINTVIESPTVDITDKTISDFNKILHHELDATDAWNALDEVSDRFAVAIMDHSFDVDGRYVNAIYKIGVVWNPKWFDDAKKLSQATSIPLQSVPENNPIAMCFSADECFFQSKFPAMRTPEIMKFNVVMTYDNGQETQVIQRGLTTPFIAFGKLQIGSSGWFSKKYDTLTMSMNKRSINYLNLDFRIESTKFGHLKSITITPIKDLT